MLAVGAVALTTGCTSTVSGTGSAVDSAPAATASSASAEVRITRGGGCGNALFWATSADLQAVVVVRADGSGRDAGRPTTIPFTLPDPDVRVDVYLGPDLQVGTCSDEEVPEDERSEPQGAAAGTGEIVLDPPADPDDADCGVTGQLEITGLVAEDGTTFGPISVTTDDIGCYAG